MKGSEVVPLFPAVAGSLPVSFFSVEKEKGGGAEKRGFGRKVRLENPPGLFDEV